MKRKRHSALEISGKLKEAADMAAAGKLQSDIARALGISVMTYHRWRQLAADRPLQSGASAIQSEQDGGAGPQEKGTRMAELQLENSRLRRLVADLLLEKLTLQDALQDGSSARRRSHG
jgi:putative transposase